MLQRFLTEIYIPVIASVLASGRVFLSLYAIDSMKHTFDGKRPLDYYQF